MKPSYPVLALFASVAFCLSSSAAPVGKFDDHTDIGNPAKTGSAKFDSARGVYEVSGGGANMWFTNDSFHFAYKQVTGDLLFSAAVSFPNTNGNPHKKACLIIRQSLDKDSAYADAAIHADGLTSLQYRPTNNARTYEIQSNHKGPSRLRIEKRGQYVSMSVTGPEGKLQPSGGSFRIEFKEPFYIGLGVCAHETNGLESALFSDVQWSAPPPAPAKPVYASTLETITIASKDRRAIYWTTNLIEAPNWTPDGKWLIFNSRGSLWKIPPAGGEVAKIDTGFATRCNNDHGISPDGKTMVISDQSQERRSVIYTLPIEGGAPTRITTNSPSYWHGWSPDGKTLAFCGERNTEFDIYTIAATGGEEKRLTTAKGLDDGPEYSPDGHYIYFNSDRTGQMQIWRMRPDGAEQEQVTKDEFNNWFPHISPDGRLMVFLSYDKSITGHPANKDVTLRIMTLSTGRIELLATLFGGQGTINVPSWSPDSRRLSFVSYSALE